MNGALASKITAECVPEPANPSSITILFPGAGRRRRLQETQAGLSPREFFYGALDFTDRGCALRYGDTRQDPSDALGRAHLMMERVRNRIAGFGLSRQRVAALRSEIDGSGVAISFTDGFSLSLGRYRRLLEGGAVLVGGFHGLADMPDEVAGPFRPWARAQIRKAVAGLDHLFFFGEADRKESIRRFGVPEAKTSLFLFGVDTDFWSPSDNRKGDFVLSVGSDPKRDYATLLAADIAMPVRIITRLNVKAPAGRPNIEIVRGGYHNVATDAALRGLYREAAIVAVPVRDVFQPSGYSVTLQAMACGKPVVLSRIKGLWDPDVFKSGENCLLVEPGNPGALAEAVVRLHADAALRKRIGDAARATAVQSFPLQRMNESLADLVERCRAKA